MRYKIDWNGYVSAVAFGCYLDNSLEYKGEVPIGYSSLDEWATNACINAYYLDSSGNLVIDYEKLAEISRKSAQQAVDNAPLLRKDIYGSEEILDSQYIKATATGDVITLENIQTIIPKVKITGVQPYKYGKFELFTNGKNLMPCDAVTTSYSGVSFTRDASGLLVISGTTTADIEYTIAGSDANEEVLFTMKKGKNYHLNLGGLTCEMRHTSGELTKQKYAGASGVINLSESIEVTQVLVTIPKGTVVYKKAFYPQLELGNAFTEYEEYKKKSTMIDFSKYVVPRGLYPSDNILPSDSLYPDSLTYFKDTSIEYILLENGVIYASVDGIKQVIGSGSAGLYSAYDTIYATQDVTLEMEYSTNVYDIDNLDFMREKETTSNKFRVLKDGSIEAHNGYFSGKIAADEGYFKGDVQIERSSFDFDVFTLKSDNYVINCTSDSLEVFDLNKKEFIKVQPNGTWLGEFSGYPHENGLAGQVLNDSYYAHHASVLGTLYTASGTVSKSDRNTKTDIKELDTEKASEFIYSLKPSQYKYKDGTSDRYHHGFIAQDVKESMGAEDWGVYVDTSLDENNDKDVKMLRYEELIADLVATIQQQNKRISQLEERMGGISE